MYVLITVPHGFCIPTEVERMCDRRAEESAKILADLLSKKAISHKIIHSHVPRALVDMNRDKPTIINDTIVNDTIINNNKTNLSRAVKAWDKYNNRIAATIMKYKAQPILFIDVHSFPKGSFGQAQIAILDILKKDRPELKTLVKTVRSELGLNVQLLKGGKNYIQDQYQADAYPLLIEFCEDREYLSSKAIKDFFTILIGASPYDPA